MKDGTRNVVLFGVLVLCISVLSFFTGRWSVGSEKQRGIKKRTGTEKASGQKGDSKAHKRAKTEKGKSDRTGEIKHVYILQVEALESEESAANLKDELLNRGFPAYVDEKTGKDGMLYRVRVGKYYSSKAAESISAKLEKGGHEVWIIKEQQ